MRRSSSLASAARAWPSSSECFSAAATEATSSGRNSVFPVSPTDGLVSPRRTAVGTVSVFTFGGSTRLRAAFVFPPLGRVGLIGVAKTLSGDGWAARDEEEEGGERARTSPCRRIRLRRAWLRISPSWGLGEYDASRCWFGADIVSFPLYVEGSLQIPSDPSTINAWGIYILVPRGCAKDLRPTRWTRNVGRKESTHRFDGWADHVP